MSRDPALHSRLGRRLVKTPAAQYTSRMHRPIDPKVDCVFKTLFGSDDHRDLLIHFLNALLTDDLAAPITAVDILNPYNERETLDDKLTVVDVKARDPARRLFQVEIQLLVFANLAPRILYVWADLFSQQLQRGEDYRVLQPVYIPSARGFSAAVHAPRTPGRRCASSP
jgi:predicted transposase/invertase (TIGR01784 family)